jgi:hypothetical protein
MKKTLYKPEADDIDVNVAVYAAEAFINRGCAKNTSGCGNRCNKPWSKNFDIFCRKGKGNQVCPRE